MKLSKGWLATLVILFVIITDQVVKIWVKTHMYLGESHTITSWFQIYFVENNGMAFGMELGSKLFLTLFRIAAVGVLLWIIYRLSKHPETKKRISDMCGPNNSRCCRKHFRLCVLRPYFQQPTTTANSRIHACRRRICTYAVWKGC